MALLAKVVTGDKHNESVSLPDVFAIQAMHTFNAFGSCL